MTIKVVQCAFCKHFRREQDGAFCDAFPDGDGIPKRIIEGEHDHRARYPGDRGVRFDPIDDESARIVGAMFAEDDEQ